MRMTLFMLRTLPLSPDSTQQKAMFNNLFISMTSKVFPISEIYYLYLRDKKRKSKGRYHGIVAEVTALDIHIPSAWFKSWLTCTSNPASC